MNKFEYKKLDQVALDVVHWILYADKSRDGLYIGKLYEIWFRPDKRESFAKKYSEEVTLIEYLQEIGMEKFCNHFESCKLLYENYKKEWLKSEFRKEWENVYNL